MGLFVLYSANQPSVRADQIVHRLTMATLDFDVFAGTKRLVFDFLKKAIASGAAHFNPMDVVSASPLKQSRVERHGRFGVKAYDCRCRL